MAAAVLWELTETRADMVPDAVKPAGAYKRIRETHKAKDSSEPNGARIFTLWSSCLTGECHRILSIRHRVHANQPRSSRRKQQIKETVTGVMSDVHHTAKLRCTLHVRKPSCLDERNSGHPGTLCNVACPPATAACVCSPAKRYRRLVSPPPLRNMMSLPRRFILRTHHLHTPLHGERFHTVTAAFACLDACWRAFGTYTSCNQPPRSNSASHTPASDDQAGACELRHTALNPTARLSNPRPFPRVLRAGGHIALAAGGVRGGDS
jgi:hypothetical protein